jgi:hypothetical protein
MRRLSRIGTDPELQKNKIPPANLLLIAIVFPT